jgi:NAD(P)H dehydrogenase (quinone)
LTHKILAIALKKNNTEGRRFYFVMKKTLIITAHPSTKGFTHKIAQVFSENAKDAEILNLYTEKPQPFLHFEDIQKISPSRQTTSYQKKITAADHLVFIHPIWWGLPPAIMKNFCDNTFTSGFAFEYKKGESMPKGLLKGKKAYIFMTADAPTWMFSFLFPIPKKFWSHSLFGALPFCGIKVKHIEIFGNMRNISQEKKEKCLTRVKNVAMNIKTV